MCKELINDVWSAVREAKYYDCYAPIDSLKGEVNGNEWVIGSHFDENCDRNVNTLTVNGITFDFPMFVYSRSDGKIHICDDKADREFEKNIRNSIR